MKKLNFSQNLTGVRRPPVYTGAGTHCVHRYSAYRYALCITPRLRTTVKVKKNGKLIKP